MTEVLGEVPYIHWSDADDADDDNGADANDDEHL